MTRKLSLLILAGLLFVTGVAASEFEVDKYALAEFLNQTGIGVQADKPITTSEKLSGMVLVTEKLDKLGIKGTQRQKPVSVVFSNRRDVVVTFPDLKKKAVLFLKNYRWQLKSLTDLDK